MSVGSHVYNIVRVLSALSVKMQCCCFRSAASACCSGFWVTALVQLKLLCQGLITFSRSPHFSSTLRPVTLYFLMLECHCLIARAFVQAVVSACASFELPKLDLHGQCWSLQTTSLFVAYSCHLCCYFISGLGVGHVGGGLLLQFSCRAGAHCSGQQEVG